VLLSQLEEGQLQQVLQVLQVLEVLQHHCQLQVLLELRAQLEQLGQLLEQLEPQVLQKHHRTTHHQEPLLPVCPCGLGLSQYGNTSKVLLLVRHSGL
jgi:hypothetical protein